MQAEATTEVQLRAARQLALHLRQNPEDAQRPSEELAEKFGLPAAFVSDVLSGVQGTVRKSDPWFPKLDLSFLVRAYQRLNRFFDRLTANPVAFVLATTAVVVVIFLTSNSSADPRGNNIASEVDLLGFIGLLLGLLSFGLHMIMFFKKRMIRFALLSGLGLWIGLASLSMIVLWLNMKDEPIFESTLLPLLLLVALVLMLICAVYAALGSGAAVLGAYLDMLRTKLREDRMSRQELLEHYFAMQERLDASEGLAPKPGIFDTVFVKALLDTGPLWALLTGLVLNTLDVLATMAAGVAVGTNRDPGWPVFAQIGLMGLALLAYILAGFFAKNFLYATLQSLAVTIGGIPPVLIGIQVFNIRQLEGGMTWWSLVISAVSFLFVSLFGALGGVVQRRAAKELNLAQNDPAAILAEMVRLQWRLSDRRSALCVMVVDAAKSAEMKSLADPLAVEYSFREYQHLLTDLSAPLRGRVHSTAGDGAVVAFESAQEGFTAAKRIQTDIERFNREDNRLQLPFRLRIGLHMGEIVGDLDEVVFTEVIDIAAHVQAAAPVGGIAVTEEVANHLPIEEFIPLAVPVDGKNVLLALNPTVDKPWQSFAT
jgi:class 3 adenylate cyclase